MITDYQIYLAQRYKGKEQAAYEFAKFVCLELMSKGLLVYSPILHSHPIEEKRLDYNHNTYDPQDEYSVPDYVADDLAKLALLCLPIESDGLINDVEFKFNGKRYQYQPRIVIAFAEDCWKMVHSDHFGGISQWDSKGAFAEYQFAQKWHIRCVTLQSVRQYPTEPSKWVNL